MLTLTILNYSRQDEKDAAVDKQGQQPGVASFFSPAPPSPSGKKAEEDALLRFIIMQHEPFSIVESPAFREYQRALNRKALIYTTRSFKDLVRTRTLFKREQLLGLFRDHAQDKSKKPASALTTAPLSFSAVTSDGWTSALKESYTSLSHHVISESFDLYSYPFDIEKIDGHTYGVNVAAKITNMAAAWGAAITVASTDCEASMVASWRSMDHAAQGCSDHRFEKVAAVFFDMPGHKEIMVKARALAGHFHHSSQACAKLMETSKLLFGAEHIDGLSTVQVSSKQ
jgi:hypothetical protein